MREISGFAASRQNSNPKKRCQSGTFNVRRLWLAGNDGPIRCVRPCDLNSFRCLDTQLHTVCSDA